MRISPNSNLTSIITYINDSQTVVTWNDLVSWCIDLKYYKELYYNHFIINYILVEHNESILNGSYERLN